MDFYPENILLEITALLNGPVPPTGPGEELERSGLAFPEFKRIWWLEYYLQAAPETFREKFLSLSAPEQQDLAVWLFRCFLYRPRVQRLYPARFQPESNAPWELVRGGSLASLAGSETGGAPAGVYYIFPHSRIWPDLLNRLDWVSFLHPGELKHLERELEFVSASRLSDVRDRAERVRALLNRTGPEQEAEPSPAAPPEPPETSGPETPVSPIKKRGRKKKSPGQLSLFD